MATVTIQGTVREVRFSVDDLEAAENLMVKNTGRTVYQVLGFRENLFAKSELDALLWGAWRHRLAAPKITALLAAYYAEGGTIPQLHAVITEALVESGLYGRRQTPEPEEDGADPQPATGADGRG